jgi:hypothetical protein
VHSKICRALEVSHLSTYWSIVVEVEDYWRIFSDVEVSSPSTLLLSYLRKMMILERMHDEAKPENPHDSLPNKQSAMTWVKQNPCIPPKCRPHLLKSLWLQSPLLSSGLEEDEAQVILEESCETIGGRWRVLTPAKNIADATYIIDAMIDIDEMIYDEFGGGEGPTFDPPTFTN